MTNIENFQSLLKNFELKNIHDKFFYNTKPSLTVKTIENMIIKTKHLLYTDKNEYIFF